MPTDDLTPWLEELQARLNRMLDPNSQVQPEQKVQDLLIMSNRLLFFSKCLMELATKASQAAQEIVKQKD